MVTMTDAEKLLRAMLAEYGGNNWHGWIPGDGHDKDVIDDLRRALDNGNGAYLLVEQNERGGYWLSIHHDPDDAADYHNGDEYAEEWTVVALVDLRTGKRYTASTVIVWDEECDA